MVSSSSKIYCVIEETKHSFFLFRCIYRIFGITVYFSYSTLLYHLIFDKRLLNHPKFMKNQIWNEIKMSIQSFPIVSIFIATLLLLEVRGYSKLYNATADGPGRWYDVLQIPLFFLFSECFAYWNHRFSHHPRVYCHFLYMHKLHHRFIVPTPFSALAAHPIDALSVPFPCLIFPFIFPLQKMVHIGLIVVLNFWNIVIHDGKFRMNNRILVSSASHSLHHVQRKCNFGFYLTIFDRLHGTYRKPENWMFQEKRRLNEIQLTNEYQVLQTNDKREKCE